MTAPVAHLSSSHGEFRGTVDPFKGNQADIVVISFVRNNGDAEF
jgi:superfamily I DNA and/or RNA helicase